MNRFAKKAVSVGLSLVLSVGFVGAMSGRVMADEEEDTLKVLEEYTRLKDAEAGDALDAFMNNLPEEQRLFIESFAQLMDDETPVGDISWEVSEDGVLTISGTGAMKHYTVSEPAPWYAVRDKIVKVVVQKGVTRIGSYAFCDLEKVTELSLPEGLETIGWASFRECKSLKNLILPLEIKIIGGGAFQGCESLTSVTVPQNVKALEYAVFKNCKQLKTVTLPAELEKIGVSAFNGCSELKVMNIPKGLLELCDNAFANCTKLENLTIPAEIRELPSGLLRDCTSLSSVTLPTEMTIIGDEAFAGCKRLSVVLLPKSLTTVGEAAFADCTALTGLELPESLETIGNRAFSGCIKLDSVKMGEKVTTIGDEAFAGSGLKTVSFIGNAPAFGKNVFGEQKISGSYLCSGEGWTEEVLSALGEQVQLTKHHVEGKEEVVPAKEATCTEDGMLEGKKCSVCGDVLQGQQGVHALGHVPSEEDPTVCAHCGEKLTAEEPAETAAPAEETTAAAEETEATAVVEESAEATEETAASMEETTAAEEVTEETTVPVEEGENIEVEPEEPQSAVLKAEPVSATAGSKVTVVLSLENNPGLVSLFLNLEYDDTLMKLVEVEDLELLSGAAHAEEIKMPCQLNWVNDTLEENITASGGLVKLTFEIAQTAPNGEIPLKIVCDSENGDVYNCGLDAVELTVEDIAVTVISSVPGDVNRDGKVDKADAEALAAYLIKKETDIDLAAADVNCDGKVNNLDRAILTRHLAGWKGYEVLGNREEK